MPIPLGIWSQCPYCPMHPPPFYIIYKKVVAMYSVQCTLEYERGGGGGGGTGRKIVSYM